MARLYLVRHGRASAGWNVDPDPGLDDTGRRQAAAMAAELTTSGPLRLVSSPLQRCQQTAAALAAVWREPVQIEPRVAEIPSPIGVAMTARVEWLRIAMAGCWSDLEPRYRDYRDDVVACVRATTESTVIVSHFVAINAVIGAALGDDRLVIRSLDNCSVTVIDVDGDELHLIEGGHEADTLIR